MEIFKQTYAGESLYDVDRDISECFQNDYNPKIAGVPVDEHGFHKGTFVVTVTWVDDSDD